MSDGMEALEPLIEQLRSEVRRATVGGDRVRASEMRAELREAEHQWEDALAKLQGEPRPGSTEPAAASPAGPLLPAREQVHQALTLLGAPAAPRLIVSVHDAFYAGRLVGSRLTSLRRDEERSFRAAPYSRPYYLCAALTADLLAPARGLLAVSTWPMDRRVIGPLSPRVDYLTAAIAVADRLRHAAELGPQARRLLWTFAANIPGAASSFPAMRPEQVASAARTELAIHVDADAGLRASAGRRARAQLDDAEQLFGTGLRLAGRTDASA